MAVASAHVADTRSDKADQRLGPTDGHLFRMNGDERLWQPALVKWWGLVLRDQVGDLFVLPLASRLFLIALGPQTEATSR